MAEFQYITNEEAEVLMPEPLGGIGDSEILAQVLIDASDEIDAYMTELGVKVDKPISETYRTDQFKIAVAYWATALLYETHSNPDPDEAARKMKRAKEKIRRFVNTTHWTDAPVTQSTAVPTTVPYSNKGDVNLTDLTDPLNLDAG